MENASNLREIEHRERERRSAVMQSRIPQEQTDRFEALRAVYSDMNRTINDQGMKYLRFQYINELNASNPAYGLHDEAEAQMDRAEAEALRFQLARNGAALILEAVVTGNDAFLAQIGTEERAELETALTGTGFTVDDMLDMPRELKGSLLPASRVHLDVQEAFPGLAEGFLGARDLSSLSQMERDFAAHNFDAAFCGMFTGSEQKSLKAQGDSQFDRIFIDGVSVAEIARNRYPGAVPEETLKCEVIHSVLNGRTVEASLPGAGPGARIPVALSSSIPALQTAVEANRQAEDLSHTRTTQAPEKPSAVRMDFSSLLEEEAAESPRRKMRETETRKPVKTAALRPPAPKSTEK
jgi:hypothetical protein